MPTDRRINYVELPATDLAATKRFYAECFGWRFTDWGPTYVSFAAEGAGIDGGFRGDGQVRPAAADTGALVILYADDLEATQARVEAAGAEIVKPIFHFPGGRRFQFKDPNGNELAVWSAT